MADSAKVKIQDKILFYLKQAVFLPIILFLPVFIDQPSCRKIVLLSIVVVYYFLCFMGPVYLLRFLIKKFPLSQKFVDNVSFLGFLFMYIFSVFNWVKVFIGVGESFSFTSALFLIPFLALVRVASVIVITTFIYVCYLILKKKKEL